MIALLITQESSGMDRYSVELAKWIGMKSVWFKWNKRYPALLSSCEKKPDFIIRSLFELPEVLGLS